MLSRNLEGPREGSASVSAGPRQRPVHEPGNTVVMGVVFEISS